ncbi:MAG: winged helix-turn-helix transcriptional regulator [Spirochaetes bacterium]|nr:winged helix-turn-helix transcriptional regulator [Spirochaetota bacterium]MBU0954645.1 winged helix-turn-helix transcriptional regulator [Spirochaetota bacterium]
MTNREEAVLRLIKENPQISQKDLAQRLGIERSSVSVHIANLMRKGIILGKGYIVDSIQAVAVIGAANMDISGRCIQLLERESNIGQIKLSAGGVGRNIAEVLARLDIPVSLYSALGEDAHGQAVLDSCRDLGIDTSLIQLDRDLPTSVYLEVLGPDGDMRLGVNDMQLTSRIDPAYIQRHSKRIRNAALAIVDANISEKSLMAVADTGQARLFADPVSLAKAPRLQPILPRLYGLKPNKAEAEILSGVAVNDYHSAYEAIRALQRKGVSAVALSLGAEGVVASDGKEAFLLRVRPRGATGRPPLVSTTGCGDAFLGAWAAGTWQGLSFRECMSLAMSAADFNSGSGATIHEEMTLEAIQSNRKEVQIHELDA